MWLYTAAIASQDGCLTVKDDLNIHVQYILSKASVTFLPEFIVLHAFWCKYLHA